MLANFLVTIWHSYLAMPKFGTPWGNAFVVATWLANESAV